MGSAISVSQLIQYLRRSLVRDDNLQGVFLVGEISNFVAHRSGHCYFTLKDESSKISCVMFASFASKMIVPVENGMQVFVRGNVSLYEAGGTLQLYVESMTPEGSGLLHLKLEEAKKRFLAQGLFDASHKKPLVRFPQTIAVISAKEGAATQDVFTTLARRWPIASILFFPCLVQGASAAAQIAEVLSYADSFAPDVILLVRGGGSIEDLWAFNEEVVIQAVYRCKSVVVSGVGHETDTTLVDYVSDHRAPTPTAAAELATPNIVDIQMTLATLRSRLVHNASSLVLRNKQQLTHLREHPFLRNPRYVLQQKQQQLDMNSVALHDFVHRYEKRKHQYEQLKHQFLSTDFGLTKHKEMLQMLELKLQNELKHVRNNKGQQLLLQIAKLEANSPLAIMKKGYALTYQDETIIKSIHTITMDQPIHIQYPDGELQAMPTQRRIQHDNTTITDI